MGHGRRSNCKSRRVLNGDINRKCAVEQAGSPRPGISDRKILEDLLWGSVRLRAKAIVVRSWIAVDYAGGPYYRSSHRLGSSQARRKIYNDAGRRLAKSMQKPKRCRRKVVGCTPFLPRGRVRDQPFLASWPFRSRFTEFLLLRDRNRQLTDRANLLGRCCTRRYGSVLAISIFTSKRLLAI